VRTAVRLAGGGGRDSRKQHDEQDTDDELPQHDPGRRVASPAMTAPLREIDEGWDYKILILEDEWVLRVPRNRLAVEELEKEARLLPALAPVLPVEIPRYEYVSREPWFVVYRLIRGEPLEDEDPDGVRAFLEALHSFDASGLDVPKPDWRGIYRGHAEDWRRIVLPLLDAGERARGEALLREIETLTGYEPALVHCDLGSSHLICRDGKLVGVIDWADAKIGDPAIDYAVWLNGPFPDWDVDDELCRRALIYHRLGPWHEVDYGVRIQEPEWVRTGLAGVRSRL
jgi:aminoglycoside phosphotransferase (APT) family kinase protein